MDAVRLCITLVSCSFTDSSQYFVAFQVLYADGVRVSSRKRTEVCRQPSCRPVFKRNTLVFEVPTVDLSRGSKLHIVVFHSEEQSDGDNSQSGQIYAQAVTGLSGLHATYLKDRAPYEASFAVIAAETTDMAEVGRISLRISLPQVAPDSLTAATGRPITCPMPGAMLQEMCARCIVPWWPELLRPVVLVHDDIHAWLSASTLTDAWRGRRSARSLYAVESSAGVDFSQVLVQDKEQSVIGRRDWPWRCFQALNDEMLHDLAQLSPPTSERSVPNLTQHAVYRVVIESMGLINFSHTHESAFRVVAVLADRAHLQAPWQYETGTFWQCDSTSAQFSSQGAVKQPAVVVWQEELLVACRLPESHILDPLALRVLLLEERLCSSTTGARIELRALHHADFDVSCSQPGSALQLQVQVRSPHHYSPESPGMPAPSCQLAFSITTISNPFYFSHASAQARFVALHDKCQHVVLEPRALAVLFKPSPMADTRINMLDVPIGSVHLNIPHLEMRLRGDKRFCAHIPRDSVGSRRASICDVPYTQLVSESDVPSGISFIHTARTIDCVQLTRMLYISAVIVHKAISSKDSIASGPPAAILGWDNPRTAPTIDAAGLLYAQQVVLASGHETYCSNWSAPVACFSCAVDGGCVEEDHMHVFRIATPVTVQLSIFDLAVMAASSVRVAATAAHAECGLFVRICVHEPSMGPPAVSFADNSVHLGAKSAVAWQDIPVGNCLVSEAGGPGVVDLPVVMKLISHESASKPATLPLSGALRCISLKGSGSVDCGPVLLDMPSVHPSSCTLAALTCSWNVSTPVPLPFQILDDISHVGAAPTAFERLQHESQLSSRAMSHLQEAFEVVTAGLLQSVVPKLLLASDSHAVELKKHSQSIISRAVTESASFEVACRDVSSYVLRTLRKSGMPVSQPTPRMLEENKTALTEVGSDDRMQAALTVCGEEIRSLRLRIQLLQSQLSQREAELQQRALQDKALLYHILQESHSNNTLSALPQLSSSQLVQIAADISSVERSSAFAGSHVDLSILPTLQGEGLKHFILHLVDRCTLLSRELARVSRQIAGPPAIPGSSIGRSGYRIVSGLPERPRADLTSSAASELLQLGEAAVLASTQPPSGVSVPLALSVSQHQALNRTFDAHELVPAAKYALLLKALIAVYSKACDCFSKHAALLEKSETAVASQQQLKAYILALQRQAAKARSAESSFGSPARSRASGSSPVGSTSVAHTAEAQILHIISNAVTLDTTSRGT